MKIKFAKKRGAKIKAVQKFHNEDNYFFNIDY